MKKVIFGAVLLLAATPASAMVCGTGGHKGEAIAQTGQVEEPVEVGNTVCPVSGEHIKEGEEIKIEYEGKLYNLCCKMCEKDFKKDSKKFIEKIEAQQKKEAAEHAGHEGHEGHQGHAH